MFAPQSAAFQLPFIGKHKNTSRRTNTSGAIGSVYCSALNLSQIPYWTSLSATMPRCRSLIRACCSQRAVILDYCLPRCRYLQRIPTVSSSATMLEMPLINAARKQHSWALRELCSTAIQCPLANFPNTTGEAIMGNHADVAGPVRKPYKSGLSSSTVSEEASKSTLRVKVWSRCQSEDHHYETNHHTRRLRHRPAVQGLPGWFANWEGRGQLLWAGSASLFSGRRWAREQLCRRGAGDHWQNQDAEGHRGGRPSHVEGPAVTAQRAVAPPEEGRRQQPGGGPPGHQPGPEHPHPQEGHHEVHGGSGVPTMLGGLRLFPALPLDASTEQRIPPSSLLLRTCSCNIPARYYLCINTWPVCNLRNKLLQFCLNSCFCVCVCKKYLCVIRKRYTQEKYRSLKNILSSTLESRQEEFLS